MKGSIEKRAKDRFRISVHTGERLPDGTYVRIRENFRGTEPEAKTRMAQLITELTHGTHMPAEKMTVQELYDRWYREYVVENLAPRTHEFYENTYKYYIKDVLGSKKVQQVETHHLVELLLQHGAVRKKIRATLSGMFNYGLVTLKIIRQNPVTGVKISKSAGAKPGIEKRITEEDVWTMEEALKFLAHVQNKSYGLYFFIAIFTGMRQQEIFALRWENVDLETETIFVSEATKGKNKRTGEIIIGGPKTRSGYRPIPIPSELLTELQRHRPDPATGLVLPGLKSGKTLDSSMLRKLMDKYIEEAGVKRITPRNLRHTHATLSLEAGDALKDISARLGHASIAITADIYSAVTDRLRRTSADRLSQFSARIKSTLEENKDGDI